MSPRETEGRKGRDVQGLAPAPEESGERDHRTVLKVKIDGVMMDDGFGLGRRRGRAFRPLNVRDKVLGARCARWARWGVVKRRATRAAGGADNRREGFDGADGVNWFSGVFIDEYAV